MGAPPNQLDAKSSVTFWNELLHGTTFGLVSCVTVALQDPQDKTNFIVFVTNRGDFHLKRNAQNM